MKAKCERCGQEEPEENMCVSDEGTYQNHKMIYVNDGSIQLNDCSNCGLQTTVSGIPLLCHACHLVEDAKNQEGRKDE